MYVQLGAHTSGCGYKWVRLQLGACTAGCGYNWVRLQLGAPTTGCGYNWVRLQLGAATTGCGYNLVRQNWFMLDRTGFSRFWYGHCKNPGFSIHLRYLLCVKKEIAASTCSRTELWPHPLVAAAACSHTQIWPYPLVAAAAPSFGHTQLCRT
jgi:hypothetical protein